MCIVPTPAISLPAKAIGPIGRRMSAPKRERPPTPNVAEYAPRVHSSRFQSRSL